MPSYYGVDDVTGITENSAGFAASSLNTGELRRKYAFGSERLSAFSLNQTPFFRFLNKMSRKPVDDTDWKFSERRQVFQKRYAYVVGHGATSVATNDATIDGGTGPNTDYSVGDSYILRMGTDYKSSGIIENVYGQSNSAFNVGASGTRPEFFIPGQLVKTNLVTTTAAIGTAPTVGDYMVWRIESIVKNTNTVDLNVTLVRNATSDTYREFAAYVAATTVITATYSATVHDNLEARRSYVVGNAHAKGSGYPEGKITQPFSTGRGLTQIWKNTFGMDNSSRATVLKYEPDEFAREWLNTLTDHKWDINTDIYFSTQGTVDDIQYTEGAVDYLSSYGNVFSLTTTSKSEDDFMDDMTQFLDPRVNNINATLFVCRTDIYNWFRKLGGYFSNNVQAVAASGGTVYGRGNFDGYRRMTAFGADMLQFDTGAGFMNVVRDVHLDGTHVKIMAINMANVKWRPLVGNGINRDTTVYLGVQTIENSGVDVRTDLVQTEGGMQWKYPSSHAIWT